MRDSKKSKNIGVTIATMPVITPNFKSTPNWPVGKCAASHFARAMKLNTGVIKQDVVPKK